MTAEEMHAYLEALLARLLLDRGVYSGADH